MYESLNPKHQFQH